MSVLAWHQQAWGLFRDRLESGQLAHAMLLQGPEGTGKLRLAQAMQARLLCTGSAEFACGECRSCQVRAGGAHPDQFTLTPEEGKHQIRVDQVREMIGALVLTTTFSPRKAALLYPAEAMNENAANALLKNLEEPPGETVIILVSHDPARLPATIRSRCQAMSIPLPERGVAMGWLTGTAGLEPGEAEAALEAAGGSPLRAAQMADAGQVAQHRGLRQSLSGLLKQPDTAGKVAAELGEMDSISTWSWLSLGCAEVLRAIMSGNASWLGKDLRLDVAGLARLQQQADRNRALARTPVRQDLLLQEWLINWANLAR